jgi:hypothetical protein
MSTGAVPDADAGITRSPSLRDGSTIEHLLRDLREAPGATHARLRSAVLNGGELPSIVAAYVAKVQERSHEVTQADIDALLAAGFDEDAVFELTVAAATGAANRILHATLRAIEEA